MTDSLTLCTPTVAGPRGEISGGKGGGGRRADAQYNWLYLCPTTIYSTQRTELLEKTTEVVTASHQFLGLSGSLYYWDGRTGLRADILWSCSQTRPGVADEVELWSETIYTAQHCTYILRGTYWRVLYPRHTYHVVCQCTLVTATYLAMVMFHQFH